MTCRHPVGCLGERCELSQRGSGGAPITQRFSTIFSTQNAMACTDTDCGLSFSHWGQDPPCHLSAYASGCGSDGNTLLENNGANSRAG